MPKRLRDRVQGRQEGFTLIELLVVILIIGILAAVAIPTFLSQKGKAQDANIQTNLNTLQTAEQTYNTSSSNWVQATSALPTLTNIEPTIKSFTPQPTIVATTTLTDPNGGSTVAYAASIVSPSGVTYSLTSWTDGGLARTCNVPSGTNAGACNTTNGGSGAGTWGS